LVEVIDLISSDEDSDDVLPPPPSYIYEVDSDDEDINDVLPPPPLHRNVASATHRSPTIAVRRFDNNLNAL
jgi:hypothetical protein